jgi:hypothetical protein
LLLKIATCTKISRREGPVEAVNKLFGKRSIASISFNFNDPKVEKSLFLSSTIALLLSLKGGSDVAKDGDGEGEGDDDELKISIDC